MDAELHGEGPARRVDADQQAAAWDERAERAPELREEDEPVAHGEACGAGGSRSRRFEIGLTQCASTLREQDELPALAISIYFDFRLNCDPRSVTHPSAHPNLLEIHALQNR